MVRITLAASSRDPTTVLKRKWFAVKDNAIGRIFRFRDSATLVVGIARDAKYARLDEAAPPFVYFPLAQVWQPSQTLLVSEWRVEEKRNKRFYRLSAVGQEVLTRLLSEWRNMNRVIDGMLAEPVAGERRRR